MALRTTFRSRLRATSVLIALALIGSGGGALAQTQDSGFGTGPSQELSPPTAPPPSGPEHLLGDWGGIQPYLVSHGVTLLLNDIEEFAGNPTGGLHQGSTDAGQVGVQADIDWTKLAGVPGLSTHTVLVERHGQLDSNLIGDHLNPSQEIYGAGGNTVVHLVYAYAQESLADGRVDVALGRMPELNDFSASPLYCNFMNNSLCGNPKLLPSADIGISSYPDSVWAGRIRVRPTSDTYIQFGAYEVSQGLYNYQYVRSNFNFGRLSSQDSGVELPVEVAYEPQIGPDKMPGHYKLGYAFDTSQNKKYLDTLQSFQAGTRGNGQKSEVWALADQMVLRNGPGATDGVILLGGYAHATPSLSNYTDQLFAGALYRNFWTARPKDTIGLLWNYTRVSGALGKQQALDIAFGLPLAGTPLGNSPYGVQTFANNIELNYAIHVYRGVTFIPDFQYYFRPNAQSSINDAFVLGFKSNISF